MICLADTNVLLRFADRREPLHPTIRRSVRELRSRGFTFRTTGQNFAEFWNVATRPKQNNGWGKTTAQAARWLTFVERVFPLLPDSDAAYPHWRRLIISLGVSGVKTHDARLVALMLVHGVQHLLTLNPADFARYASEGIVALDPRTLVAAP